MIMRYDHTCNVIMRCGHLVRDAPRAVGVEAGARVPPRCHRAPADPRHLVAHDARVAVEAVEGDADAVEVHELVARDAQAGRALRCDRARPLQCPVTPTRHAMGVKVRVPRVAEDQPRDRDVSDGLRHAAAEGKAEST